MSSRNVNWETGLNRFGHCPSVFELQDRSSGVDEFQESPFARPSRATQMVGLPFDDRRQAAVLTSSPVAAISLTIVTSLIVSAP